MLPELAASRQTCRPSVSYLPLEKLEWPIADALNDGLGCPNGHRLLDFEARSERLQRSDSTSSPGQSRPVQGRLACPTAPVAPRAARPPDFLTDLNSLRRRNMAYVRCPLTPPRQGA